MSKRTYTVVGIGSVGPAHPSYRPDVTVTIFEDGQRISSTTMPNGRAGHRWALEQGCVLHPSQAERADQPWYQLMLSELGLAPAVPVSELTYSVMGKGSFGPAHPLHNPAVDVRIHRDGRIIDTVVQPDSRSGHRWAVEKGYVLHPSQAERAEQSWYQEMLADIRHGKAA